MHPDQMAALLAVADTGSFERAASALAVSTSAVSQRIRALESSLGRVLIQRGSPSRVTAQGATVLRYARQQQLLAGEMSAELGLGAAAGAAQDRGCHADGPCPAPEPVEIAVAVNLDSLATWFPTLFPEIAHWPDLRLRLVADNEGRTAELLREGSVMAAISAARDPVAGCSSQPLGRMRYLPVASPALLSSAGLSAPGAGPHERLQDGALDRVARLPVLRFDGTDDLQDLVLSAAGLPSGLPGPQVPGNEAYARALEAGMGWGLLPRPLLDRHPGLLPVPGLVPLDRELTWYRWRLRSALLDRLTSAVHRAFAAHRERGEA
ncbi:ArgP/LysG family DNA-binding transcriptional regulator [Actinomyces bowdenii]|uniref:ArgP/LysG family DNA-binding transcriptional regulator n=1 Tax=Actinomyces bowdenii TaxID=131109 RepID=UPI001ABCD7CD|nr:ArgP/LysG family DNA-binding transcriptional regulator [Actinomyces bowdenii]MBO3725156.1 ArgP/LysG family DNA-binding transcriptional regulator [Actinomyces bowdenii]